jgi:transcriptional regulator with XRE-family HTH domain
MPSLSCMPASWDLEAAAPFTEYLRSLMREAGIQDFAELSRLTGVNQTQFSNWTRGKTRPSRESLKKITPALGLTSPLMLYLAAGLDEPGDHQLEQPPDFAVLPRPLQELYEVYERFAALGQTDRVLSAIQLVLPGLKAELAMVEGIHAPRTNVRRRRPA